MHMFVTILINKTGAALPLRIHLDIITNQVTIEEVLDWEPDDQPTASKTLPEDNQQGAIIGSGTNLAKDFTDEATNAIAAPVTRVPEESMIGKQVELVHTHHQRHASLESIEMVSAEVKEQKEQQKEQKCKPVPTKKIETKIKIKK